MTHDSKSRQPGDSVFATFKIPYDKWQHFQQVAQLEGKTASATLVAFIESYLSQQEPSDATPTPSPASEPLFSKPLEKPLEELLENRLQEAVAPTIARLEEKLTQLEMVLRKFDERLGKVETSVSQWKAHRYQPPKLVDVEVVTIEGEIANRPSSPTHLPTEPGIGVAERALCEQFGLNPNNLVRHAKMRGLSASEYLHQVTGWVYRDGKYYPGDWRG